MIVIELLAPPRRIRSPPAPLRTPWISCSHALPSSPARDFPTLRPGDAWPLSAKDATAIGIDLPKADQRFPAKPSSATRLTACSRPSSPSPAPAQLKPP